MKIKFSNFVKLFLAGVCFAAVGCTDYGQDIENLNNRIDALETDTIAALAEDLEKVKEALEGAKTDLQSKIDENKALINDLTDELAAAKAGITKNAGDIEKLNDAVDKLDTAVEGLKANDAAFAADIEALKLAVANNTAKIEDLEKAGKETKQALEDHLAAYALFVARVDAELLKLAGEIEALKKKDAELAGLIAGIDARLTANEELTVKIQKDLELLQAAHLALESRVVDLEKWQAEITKQLEEHFAAFEQYTKETNEKLADLYAKHDAQQIAIEANAAAIEGVVKDLAAAKKELQDNIDATNKALADYKEQVATIVAGLEAGINANTNAIKVNADAIKDLQTAVSNLDKKVDALKADLEAQIAALKKALEDKIAAVSAGLEALKARIQSLVYVPEYEDGKATIEWAVLGTTVVEAQSVLKYQVHPVECAGAIAAEELSFLFTEALKTRAAAPALEVVDVQVVDKAKGIIAVYANARNLDKLYAGTETYAVSLVFNGATGKEEESVANIASPYTTLIAAKDAHVIDVELINATQTKVPTIQYNDLTTTHTLLPNHDYQFTVNGVVKGSVKEMLAAGYEIVVTKKAVAYTLDPTSKPNVFKNEVAEGDYLNVATVGLAESNPEAVNLVETVTYAYNVCGKDLTASASVKVVKIQGAMTLDAQTITWARSKDNQADGITAIDPTSRLVETKAGELSVKDANLTYADIIAIAPKTVTINGEEVAAPSVVFGGTTDVPTVQFTGFEWNKTYDIVALFELESIDATISMTINTVQNSDAVVLAPQTITWNYAADKASDKGADTFRAVETTADKAELYADVIANGKLISVTPGFVLTATGFEFTGFAWNSKYAFTAEYALEDKLVTVTGSVETVKEAFIDLVINLADAQWLLTKDFVNQSETPAESLEAIFAGLTNLGDITAAAYLKDIFVDNTYDVIVDQANGSTLANTKLVIEPTTGASIKSVYNIDDFTTIPTAVAYAYNVTTWYGQKISFTKNLNINLQPVEVTLNPETKKIVADLAFTTEAESLAALYESNVNVDKASITAADDFLKAIFVTNAPKSHEALANGAVLADTKLVVDAVKGNTAAATYAYTDFATTPKTVVYKSTYKTWYGQDVTINKVITIDWTTYNYEHIEYFVYDVNGVYYSQPVRENKNIPTLSKLLDEIIFSLDMNTAFKVVDSEGVKVEDLAAAGLVSTFDFSVAPADSDIHFATGTNNLVYRGYDKTVGVKGQLKLVNSDGVETILPTNFDAGQKYAGYYVEQVNPVNKLEAADLKISVSSTLGKTYTYYAVNQLSLTDDRGKQLIAKGGIATENDVEVTYNEGGWVVGDGTEAVGFANGRSVADVYGLTAPVFECSEIPADLQSALKFENGKLTFDNTNLIKLTKPVELTVKATIVHDWIVSDSVEFKVTIVVE